MRSSSGQWADMSNTTQKRTRTSEKTDATNRFPTCSRAEQRGMIFPQTRRRYQSERNWPRVADSPPREEKSPGDMKILTTNV